jgi:hypothetical protein
MARDVLVFDIETVGVPWASLDEPTREYLNGRTRDDAEKEAVPLRLGLSPGTGRVIAIGMWDPDDDTGGVLYEGADTPFRPWDELGAGVFRMCGDEAALLRQFWKILEGRRTVVTFNGRTFDGPFVLIRSAVLGVVPSRNLVPNRYATDDHCDLADLLTFWGATGRGGTFPLDYWCRRFDVPSPKDGGLKGSEVQEAYLNGRIEDIARYCLRDVQATATLYRRLRETVLKVVR